MSKHVLKPNTVHVPKLNTVMFVHFCNYLLLVYNIYNLCVPSSRQHKVQLSLDIPYLHTVKAIDSDRSYIWTAKISSIVNNIILLQIYLLFATQCRCCICCCCLFNTKILLNNNRR